MAIERLMRLGHARTVAHQFRPRRHHQQHFAYSITSGPLSGIKVVDLSRVLAGPFCTQILADYGADVIKIEQPLIGDDTRQWRTRGEDDMWQTGDAQSSAYFATINRNKRSLTLNLKRPEARDILLGLIRRADVVVDNFVPGKLDELRIGFEDMKSVKPDIIHASISGYGATGPYSKRAGYDVIAAAEAGLLHITGEPKGRPMKPGVGLTDMCTGLYLHGAILAALRARDVTGQGQQVDTSLFETQVSLLANVAMSWLNVGQEAQRWGTAHPSIVPYDCFKTADAYFVVGAVNDRQFASLCRLLHLEDLVKDKRFLDNGSRVKNRQILGDILDATFSERNTADWMARFEGSGMPYGPINTMEKVFSHPQTIARDMIHTVVDESAKSGKLHVLGIPVKFSKDKPSIRSRAPRLGEHTEAVLTEIGFTQDDIVRLGKDGVV
ncbi:Succinate--hydroxymethylglutarate CoA-transferase [Metarhizium brunneum]|uniref:Succinate--hydroxymethylglutarate CoA-transferase n=1 Tax=Metarhizium brunneum TaxID=500148 RepID=A0A7D5V1A7_9HYPO|nr:Succinate--hydroxymethylglutarate CoA-transferase [Metarhizium brunneum]